MRPTILFLLNEDGHPVGINFDLVNFIQMGVTPTRALGTKLTMNNGVNFYVMETVLDICDLLDKHFSDKEG